MRLNKLLMSSFLFFSAQSFAAGPYDGIWEIKPFGYATVTERDNELIVVSLSTDESGLTWIASQGTRVGNKARVTSIVTGTNDNNASVVADLEMITDTVATVTQVSCIPADGYECIFPDGFQMVATKIW